MPAGSALRLKLRGTQVLAPRACALACLFAILVLAFAGIAQADRGLWQDESTLLANFGLPLRAYFGVLPFYDQAAPPLALLTLDGLWTLAGGAIFPLRLMVLALTVSIYAGAALMAWRRHDREALLALAMMAVTPLAIRYSVELKQYGFELLASLVFVLALRWAPHRPGPVMALAALLSFFSFSIMLVVGVAVLDAIVFRVPRHLRMRWLVLLVIYSLGWLACYVALFRPATALQTANYPTAYERLAIIEYLKAPGLLWSQFEVIGRAQAAVAVACGLVLTLALSAIAFGRRESAGAAARRWSPESELWQPLRVFIGLMVLVVLMWLARLYPVSTNKQFLFTMPICSLLVAALLVRAADLARRPALAPLILTVLLLPSAGYVLQRVWARTDDFQNTRGLYAFVKAHPDALILPDILFEPTLRYYVARDPQPPRRVDAWLRAETKPMETPRQVEAVLSDGRQPVFQHIWQPLYATGIYSRYAEWVVQHARGRGQAIVASTQLGDIGEAMYARAARRQGCDWRIAYRSREVVAMELNCRPR